MPTNIRKFQKTICPFNKQYKVPETDHTATAICKLSDPDTVLAAGL
jgi:hypothetical protein